jgi:Protein of unknown function (DUF1579)
MRAHLWAGAIVASGLLLAGASGLSQEPSGSSQTIKPDSPGTVHKWLAGLAGKWDVTVEYTLGEKRFEGKATCEAKLILDGKFLEQHYNSILQGKPYHVLQILCYDVARQKTIEIKLDNLSTTVMHNEGSASDDGKVLTNLGEHLDPRTKKPYKLRTVYTILGPDKFTLEWFQTEQGGKEAKVVSMTHERK